MQVNALQVARAFLSSIERQDFDSWSTLLAEDVVMHLPFAPAGMPRRSEGRAACQATIRAAFAIIENFAWNDVALYPAQDPELLFGTARSSARIRPDHDYHNEYCMIFRIRDGQIVDYREYFDPQPVLAIFGTVLAGH